MQQSHRKHMLSSRVLEDAGDASRHVWLADWKSFGKPYSTLYVVSPENGWPCKIGVSARPQSRISQIQVSVWKPVKVDYSVWCRSPSEARRLERALHQDLSEDGKWLQGEWFDMRPEDTVDLIKFKASVIGVECSDRIEDADILRDVESKIAGWARYMSASSLRLRITRNIA